MDSQAPLLELLRTGKVPGETGVPEHIETVMSNIFLFKEHCYKLYKDDNEFINRNFLNISTREARFAFLKSDFGWNHHFSKEIYLRLQGVKISKGSIQFVDNQEDAEDLLLVTKRLSSDASLFEHLQRNDLKETDYYEIGKQFAQHEASFIWRGDFPDESLLGNMLQRYVDIVEWIKGVEECISSEESKKYTDQFKILTERVYAHDKTKVSISIDIHSLNAFYIDGVFYPFDIYAINDSWRFAVPQLNVYRLATDVFAFVGEREFRAVVNGYFDCLQIPPPNKQKEHLFVMYAALIMVPYLYMLARTDTSKKDVAIKYHDFLRRYATT